MGNVLEIARAYLGHSELVQILLSLAHLENVSSVDTSLLHSVPLLLRWWYLGSRKAFSAKSSVAAPIG